jgi:hypothetical protein
MNAAQHSSPAGSTYEQRFGPLLAHKDAGGVLSQPWALYEHQHALGLTEGELVFLAHVFNQRRNGGLPWLSMRSIVDASGRSRGTVDGWARSLVRKGYVRLVASTRAYTGRQGSNQIDLSPLLARIERLAADRAHARKRAELDLPPPLFDTGALEGIADPPPQRIYPRHRTWRRPLTGAGMPDALPPTGAGMPDALPPTGAGMPDALPPTGAGMPAPKQRRVNVKELTSERERQTGVAGAAAPPGRKDEKGLDDFDSTTDPGAVEAYVNETVRYRVEGYAAEFGDNDVARTLLAVQHCLWNSHLEPSYFSGAMQAAAHETRKKMRRAAVERPMAFWLVRLHGEVALKCEAAGLPPPPTLKREDSPDQLERQAARLRAELERYDPDHLPTSVSEAAYLALRDDWLRIEAQLEAIEATA